MLRNQQFFASNEKTVYEVSISIDPIENERNPLKVQVEVVRPSSKNDDMGPNDCDQEIYSISIDEGDRSDDANEPADVSTDLHLLNAQSMERRSHKAENDARIREFVQLICYSCPTESMPFETFKLLQNHYEDVHQSRGYAICCDRKFFRKDRLISHITNHIDPNAFK